MHDLSLDGDSTTYVLGVPARADDLFDGASVALRFSNKKPMVESFPSRLGQYPAQSLMMTLAIS